MVALSFKRHFVEPIRMGLGLVGIHPNLTPKRHTIRSERADRRRPKPGDLLQLYCGMRTKQCFLIGEARCTDVSDIALLFDEDAVVTRGIKAIVPHELDAFARRDGFPDWSALKHFWREKHPSATSEFRGVIIMWEPKESK